MGGRREIEGVIEALRRDVARCCGRGGEEDACGGDVVRVLVPAG